MSRITTHVLDTMHGKPAQGVTVALESETTNGGWRTVGMGQTGADGRCSDLAGGAGLRAGVHRLRFEIGEYFSGEGSQTFFPRVEVTFTVRDASEHHHVPLLVSPFGFTTYRGS